MEDQVKGQSVTVGDQAGGVQPVATDEVVDQVKKPGDEDVVPADVVPADVDGEPVAEGAVAEEVTE